ncbi:hypothetical protein JYU34_018287 [Plutella xylostella]|uniref:Uncharacterized protein n=1 Tax=Plutella xylostella TaxID=51655 RepID=A0ABQ7Q068_PLUXY|nr:hypothetical protein JYU34_018287 [Plutella xylostella]
MSAVTLFLFFASAFTNLAAWTIDLPEVRQYYFSKYGNNLDDTTKVELKNDEYIYNNFHSNSEHHEHNPGYQGPIGDLQSIYEGENKHFNGGEKYAEEYEYQSYMEKKVHNIVHSGSLYLEALQRAIEEFTRRLEDCGTANYTTLVASGRYSSCARITERGEHVRRVAQLALHTAGLLRDRDYARGHEQEELFEDRALLLRLAFFLDKLTELTGFEPDLAPHLTTTPEPTTQAPVATSPFNVMNISVPEDVKLMMMNCLNNDDTSVPATERCKYPLPLPGTLMESLNVTNDNSAQNSSMNFRSSQSVLPAASPAATPVSSASARPDLDTSQSLLMSKLTASPAADETPAKSIRKRSAPSENPIEEFAKFYAKYKAWTNANPIEGKPLQHEFEDHNELRVKRSKRSATLKAIKEDVTSLMEGLKKTDQGVGNQAGQAKVLTKRSYRSRGRARVPEDPLQDISYYVKNKKGTELNPDPVQAAQVRLGLERIFRTGNPEVIRRYGSNYNPANFDHLSSGLLRSLAEAS